MEIAWVDELVQAIGTAEKSYLQKRANDKAKRDADIQAKADSIALQKQIDLQKTGFGFNPFSGLNSVGSGITNYLPIIAIAGIGVLVLASRK